MSNHEHCHVGSCQRHQDCMYTPCRASVPMTNDQSKSVADLTRPIIGIENRTAQEVFDIMADRIRLSRTPSHGRVSDSEDGRLREAADACFIAAEPVPAPEDLDEDDNPLWTAEVQTVGGWSVAATVWGASPEQASARAAAVASALSTIEEPRA